MEVLGHMYPLDQQIGVWPCCIQQYGASNGSLQGLPELYMIQAKKSNRSSICGVRATGRKDRKIVLKCELLAACLGGADLPRAKMPSTDASVIYSSRRQVYLYSALCLWHMLQVQCSTSSASAGAWPGWQSPCCHCMTSPWSCVSIHRVGNEGCSIRQLCRCSWVMRKMHLVLLSHEKNALPVVSFLNELFDL